MLNRPLSLKSAAFTVVSADIGALFAFLVFVVSYRKQLRSLGAKPSFVVLFFAVAAIVAAAAVFVALVLAA